MFGKLSKLHTKTPFSLALILGDVFADPEHASTEDEENVKSLLNGEIHVPLPIYFTLGKNPLPQNVIDKLDSTDNEVCPGLYFLGNRSTTKTSEGLRIVTLGGSLNTEATAGLSANKALPLHTESDAKALHGAKSADILITSHWPQSVRARSSIKLPDGVEEEPPQEQCIAELCSALKPRYHFSTSDLFFFEREPFFHLDSDGQPDTSSTTRFISLAAFNNISKQKWLYAFTMDPNTSPPISMPPGTTATPFTVSRKRQRLPDQEDSYSRFSRDGGNHRRHEHPKKRSRKTAPGPQECFFCLANPNLATHLITSIANDSYLTTAKGPLSTASTFPALDFPAHMLIIPLSHSPLLSSISPKDSRISTYNEMQRYRHALHSLLNHASNGALGAVTWEVSRAEGIHVHWQFLPVQAELVKNELVDAAFKVEAENEKYPFFKEKDIGDGTDETGDYFRVWIWRPSEHKVEENSIEKNGGCSEGSVVGPGSEMKGDTMGVEKSMMIPLSENFRFDLQFGRKVMAKLLGLEKRMHWQDCTQSDAEEKKDAEAFKASFKAFDFSLDDE